MVTSPTRPPVQAWFSAIWGLLASSAAALFLLVGLFDPAPTTEPLKSLVWGCFWFALFGIIPVLLGAGVLQLKEIHPRGQWLAMLGIVTGALGMAAIVAIFILAPFIYMSGDLHGGN